MQFNSDELVFTSFGNICIVTDPDCKIVAVGIIAGNSGKIVVEYSGETN